MNKKEIMESHGLTHDQYYGKAEINHHLIFDKENQKSFEEGFNPKVNGHIYSPFIMEIPKSFNPIVSDYLYLPSLTIINNEFTPKCKALMLTSLKKINASFKPVVEINLMLDNLEYCGKYFKPEVNGNIYLPKLKSKILRKLLESSISDRQLAYNLLDLI